MLYHLLGVISSLLFALTWYGLWRQTRTISERRRHGGVATQSLSINQFGSSYFAFYANFIFGISVVPFNHYLVWTRCGALFLILVILWQIWQERKTQLTGGVFVLATTALVMGFASIPFRPYPVIAQIGANVLMLMVTVILIQGTLHQLFVLRRCRQLGALSFSLFRSILIKDVSTLLFALTMPLAQAWPLLVLNGASVLARGSLLLQMEYIKRSAQGNA
jgi:peptidoglycan/LPS O-acetylase OafA/YrhL